MFVNNTRYLLQSSSTASPSAIPSKDSSHGIFSISQEYTGLVIFFALCCLFVLLAIFYFQENSNNPLMLSTTYQELKQEYNSNHNNDNESNDNHRWFKNSVWGTRKKNNTGKLLNDTQYFVPVIKVEHI